MEARRRLGIGRRWRSGRLATDPGAMPGITRRSFLELCGGAAALAAATSTGASYAWPAPGPYRVGVGRDLDAYAATVRAVAASEDWQALDLAGRTVVIKPNLVMTAPAERGGSTDPECVRALADLALAAGAAQV